MTEAQTTAASVESVITDGLVEIGAERDEITRDASLEALDVDSLDLVEMAQIIEDEFQVNLQGDDVKDVRTVGELIDLVLARA
jgi:acyl carrier protein